MGKPNEENGAPPADGKTDEARAVSPGAASGQPPTREFVSAGDRAHAFRGRGWKPIPIEPKSKGPKGKEWQKRDFGEDEFRRDGWNVGVQTGRISGGLVDIDFDWPTAARVGALTMPHAPSFGRNGNPESHRLWCVVEGTAKTRKYQARGHEKAMLLELRGEGCQTVFPGSRHPSGEAIDWADGQMPEQIPTIDYDSLVRLCDATVLLTIATEYYATEGSRHEFCLALGGALLRMGFEVDDVDDWVVGVADLAGDEEAEGRRHAAGTKAKLDSDEEVTGAPRLLELLATDEPGVRKLVEKLVGGQAKEVPDRPDVVLVAGGKLAQNVAKAERLLIEARLPIYQRGPELVQPVRLPRPTSESGVRRSAGAIVIRAIDAFSLRLMMADSATWMKTMDRKTVPADPPLDYARTLLAKRPVDFPYLLGVANCPILREDGTVAQEEGYDAASGLLLDFGGATFPAVPDQPSREQARAALNRLKQPFRAYQFEDAASASVVYSAMLTTAVSRVLPAVPAHVIDASTAGYGKSKVADCINLLATGVRAAVMSQGKNTEEDEKRIGAALRAGDPVIVIDNVELPLSGDKLCSAITQPAVSLRILGQSVNVSLEARTLFVPTGNNVRVRGDMCRRALRCRIDGGHERPDSRPFDFDPVAEVEAGRAELVVAALTVLRAYVVAGRPLGDLRPIGSFEKWNVVREALVWLGEADPEKTREEVLADDDEANEMHELLLALRAATGGEEFTVADLRKVADTHEDLRLALDADQWVGKRVSAKLNRLRGRVIGGYRLRRTREDGKRGHRYRVDNQGKGEPPPLEKDAF